LSGALCYISLSFYGVWTEITEGVLGFRFFLFKLGVERASVHVFLVDIHQGLRVTPIASQHLAVLPWRGSIQPGEGIPGEMSMLVCSRFPG
jgi:hypothetical protein